MSHRYAHQTAHVTTIDQIIPDARILVVDDNSILRGILEAILSHAGYCTDSAGDGEEALTMLALGKFDLVLTDGNMPRLDGCGLVRALRARGNRIPVMIISGSLAAGGKLPPDVHAEVAVALSKPAMPSDVLAAVAHALRPLTPAQGRMRMADARTAPTCLFSPSPVDTSLSSLIA